MNPTRPIPSTAPHWLQAPLATPWLWLIAGLPVATVALKALQERLPDLAGGLLTLLGTLVLWAVLFKTASLLLLRQAAGRWRNRDKELADEPELPDRLVARHIGLWLVATLLMVAFNASGGPIALALAIALLAATLPAMTLVLTRTGSLADALYPPDWLALWHELGQHDYLRLCGWLLAFAIVYALLVVINNALPAWLGAAVVMGWWAFATLAWFSLAGQTLYRHRPMDLPRDGAASQPSDRLDVDALFTRLTKAGGRPEEHRRLAATLDQRGDHQRLLEHGGHHIAALLLAFDRSAEAVERLDHLQALDPGFTLETPSATLALIRAADHHAYPAMTVQLCASFLRRFPSSPPAVEVRRILRRCKNY